MACMRTPASNHRRKKKLASDIYTATPPVVYQQENNTYTFGTVVLWRVPPFASYHPHLAFPIPNDHETIHVQPGVVHLDPGVPHSRRLCRPEVWPADSEEACPHQAGAAPARPASTLRQVVPGQTLLRPNPQFL